MNDTIHIYEKKIPNIEKSKCIKITDNKKCYDTNSFTFNPGKNSPPNEFLSKLLLRINNHEIKNVN